MSICPAHRATTHRTSLLQHNSRLPRRTTVIAHTGNTTTDTESEHNAPTVSVSDTPRGLMLLAEVAADRELDLENYDPLDDFTSETDAGSDAPHFYRFCNESGPEGIKKMTNFDPTQFF